jgi:AAA domain
MTWLWEPYLPRNMLVMLDGDPGLGKSMMLLQVAANLSQGRPVLDQLGKPTLAADVDGPQATLILSAEDSLEHIMVPRLRRAGADLKYIKFLDGWLGADGKPHTFTLQHIPILVQALETIKPVLVILDPLVAYLGEIDMHRSNQTRPLMADLKTLAESYGCTIMGVRHPSKLDQGGPLMYRGQGNMDIVGAARSALWVQKHPTHQADQTLMIHSKTNVGMPGRTVIFSRARGEFAWVGVTRLAEWMLSGRGPDPYAFLEAFFWLEEYMTPGVPYASAEIEEKAKEKDFSPRTLAKARKLIGAEPKKVGSRWVCTLPSLE